MTLYAVSAAEDSAYIMVFHKDEDHSLYMAYSRDGYQWTALKVLTLDYLLEFSFKILPLRNYIPEN